MKREKERERGRVKERERETGKESLNRWRGCGGYGKPLTQQF